MVNKRQKKKVYPKLDDLLTDLENKDRSKEFEGLKKKSSSGELVYRQPSVPGETWIQISHNSNLLAMGMGPGVLNLEDFLWVPEDVTVMRNDMMAHTEVRITLQGVISDRQRRNRQSRDNLY